MIIILKNHLTVKQKIPSQNYVHFMFHKFVIVYNEWHVSFTTLFFLVKFVHFCHFHVLYSVFILLTPTIRKVYDIYVNVCNISSF